MTMDGMHDETARLDQGPASGQHPNRAGLVALHVHAAAPGELLDRAKDVLRHVIDLDARDFEHQAAAHLPDWFVNACAPEPSPEERRRWLEWWRSLDHPAKVAAERDRGWTLAEWLSWMEPSERTWWWWDAVIMGPSEARVSVEVDGWPTALGALEWLLRASGATSVSEPDSGTTLGR